MSAEWLAAAEDYGSCPSALPEVEEPAEPAAVPRNTRRRKVGVARFWSQSVASPAWSRRGR